MTRLVFILGREPELSVAEIAAVLGDAGDWSRALVSHEALIVSTPSRSPSLGEGEKKIVSPPPIGRGGEGGWAGLLMRRLGGTVKIGELITENTEWGASESSSSIAERLTRLILQNTKVGLSPVSTIVDLGDSADYGRKTHFGFSVYDLGDGVKEVARIRKSILRLGPETKRLLREAGRSARWVTSREATLSSVVVAKNKLLPPDGVEFLILAAPEGTIVARTLAVQPFEDWSRRDYGRPSRSMERGMLPPKLARMMVNIATAKNSKHEARNSKQARSTKFETSRLGHSNFGFVSDFDIRYSDFTILDPFCGTGTVLMEAMRLGYRVLGSDIDPRAISETRENLCWIQRNGVCAPDEPRLAAIAAEQVSTHVGSTRVDAIVTEPYLGPTEVGSRKSEVGLTALVHKLRALYIDAFREFAKVLKPHGRVVFIVPAFRERSGVRAVEIAADIERLGFRVISPFPKELMKHPMIRDTRVLEYARPDQRVIRRFLIAERV